MEKKIIITIARQYGSGGREIGMKVAEILGIPIYDKELINLALDIAKDNGIKAQVKKFVSGGNDAGHIHKSGTGVRALALSAPTRYLHSPNCVACYDDYEAMLELLYKFILTEKLN